MSDIYQESCDIFRSCRVCKYQKNINDFAQHKDREHGRCNICKKCKNDYDKNRRRDPKTADRVNSMNRIAQKKYKDNNPKRTMLSTSRHRAKIKKLEFNIGIEDIIIPDTCPILGMPLFKNKGRSRPTANSPSIDRIDSSKGYTKDNIAIISWRANHLKNNGTIEEFKKIVKWLETKVNDQAQTSSHLPDKAPLEYSVTDVSKKFC